MIELKEVPIYRGKIKDKDQYVIGLLGEKRQSDGTFKYYTIVGSGYELDSSTLAIHFSDMLAKDSYRLLPNGEKDLRIFASLSEDGKGGDICDTDDGYRECVFIYHKYAMCIDLKCIKEIKPYNMYLGDLTPQLYKYRTKVIGIKND